MTDTELADEILRRIHKWKTPPRSSSIITRLEKKAGEAQVNAALLLLLRDGRLRVTNGKFYPPVARGSLVFGKVE